MSWGSRASAVIHGGAGHDGSGTPLVEAPGTSLTYDDPAFPNPHSPIVRSLCTRPGHADFDAGTPVLFVHHGVRRNGRDYRDYWMDLVDEAGVLAISVEFPEACFPDHLSYQFGNLHDKEGRPNLPRTEIMWRRLIRK
jgi:hypothetical protein